MNQIIETKRLLLRELTINDLEDLCEILQDKDVMYAYEHAFDDNEVQQWFSKQMQNYKTYGHGLWAVILKSTGMFIGQAGITMQNDGSTMIPEIGYLFKKAYWGSGYAAEAAIGCKFYAFEQLKMNRICSIIRNSNIASQKVAIKNGMQKTGEIIKFYYGMNMPHYIFSVDRETAV